MTDSESIHNWHEIDDMESSSSSSSPFQWDIPDMLRLVELEQLVAQVMNKTIVLSQSERLDLYMELAGLQGRLVEFQARNRNIAEDVLVEEQQEEANDDHQGEGVAESHHDCDSDGSSSDANTTTSRSNDWLRASERQALRDEMADILWTRHESNAHGNSGDFHDIVEQTDGDYNHNDGEGVVGSNPDYDSTGSSSASDSTTSSERRENDRLLDEGEELRELMAEISALCDLNPRRDSNNIPRIIASNQDDSSSGHDDDDPSVDSFTPGCRFSEDPPLSNENKTSWKDAILGNVWIFVSAAVADGKPSTILKDAILGNLDLATVLIGVSAVAFRSKLPAI